MMLSKKSLLLCKNNFRSQLMCHQYWAWLFCVYCSLSLDSGASATYSAAARETVQSTLSLTQSGGSATVYSLGSLFLPLLHSDTSQSMKDSALTKEFRESHVLLNLLSSLSCNTDTMTSKIQSKTETGTFVLTSNLKTDFMKKTNCFNEESTSSLPNKAPMTLTLHQTAQTAMLFGKLSIKLIWQSTRCLTLISHLLMKTPLKNSRMHWLCLKMPILKMLNSRSRIITPHLHLWVYLQSLTWSTIYWHS